MPQPNKRALVAEALRRGLISPERAQQMGFGSVGAMAQSGQLAPGGPVAHDVKADQERLEELRKESGLARWISDNADEFVALNKRQGTGQLLGMGTPWTGTFGDVAANWDAELGQMKGISAKVGRKMRTPGEGSTSDMETKLNQTAFPNIYSTGPANQALAQDWALEKQMRQAEQAYAEAWFAKYGTLVGYKPRFEAWWEKYDKRVDRRGRPAAVEARVEGHPEYGVGRANTLGGAPRKPAPVKGDGFKILGEE